MGENNIHGTTSIVCCQGLVFNTRNKLTNVEY